MIKTESASSEIKQELLGAVAASSGHFLYESGHHGDLWLELDALFVDARRTRSWAAALAGLAAACRPEFVCGPLTGGAFVAQFMAAEMDAGFIFSERSISAARSVHYRIPESLQAALPGRRVLLVDDAVNAGSALLSTLTSLLNCGAELAGFAALLTLGQAASQIARQHQAPFFTLASLERNMWPPEKCPLCNSGIPLVDRSLL